MSREKSSRVTIRMVAADAGVSIGFVSKVLNKAAGVSPELRERVEKSMSRLGYRPHAAARAMRGRTYALGVVLPNLRDPFFADIMDGVDEALADTAYQFMLGVGQSATVTEHAIVEAMIDRQMDGLLLVAPRLTLEELVHIGERVPTVVIGVHVPEVDAFDTIKCDDLCGAEMVVRHLADTGRRDIAYIHLSLPKDTTPAFVDDREIGYRNAMKDLGLSKLIRVAAAPGDSKGIEAAARRLLGGRRVPEAVFCWTDYVGFELISSARKLGLDVPNQVAMAGYDNTHSCELDQNSLTSVDQSGSNWGRVAVEMVLERIKGRRAARHFLTAPKLVVRGSSHPRLSMDGR